MTTSTQKNCGFRKDFRRTHQRQYPAIGIHEAEEAGTS